MESKDGSIWACTPLLIIAVMETTRVPLAGWTAHLKPFAMLMGFVIMGSISILTFEGMSYGVERFMHNRVLDVIAARDVLDAAKQKARDAETLVAKQTAEVEKRRKMVADLQTQRPSAHVSAPVQTCKGLYKGKPVTYPCKNPSDDRDSETARKAQEAFDARVADRNASLTEAEDELKKLQSADGMTADADVLAGQKGVDEAAKNSTVYRTAATWYGVPVTELTDAQFERFKRIAVLALAGAVSVATMLIAFLSHATPRNPAQKGKLVRAIRAWIARKRKNVVRTVVKTVEVPVGEKIVEKRVDVPGPERIVVKHIHVPVDLTTNRVVNRDGTLGEDFGLHVVQGGKS